MEYIPGKKKTPVLKETFFQRKNFCQDCVAAKVSVLSPVLTNVSVESKDNMESQRSRKVRKEETEQGARELCAVSVARLPQTCNTNYPFCPSLFDPGFYH